MEYVLWCVYGTRMAEYDRGQSESRQSFNGPVSRCNGESATIEQCEGGTIRPWTKRYWAIVVQAASK